MRELLPISIIILIFAIALYVGPAENGVALSLGTTGNFSLGGAWGVYLIPMLTLIIYLCFLAIPKIEVYQKNLKHFEDHFWGFKVVLVFVMGVIYVATLIPSLGYWSSFEPIMVIIPAVAILFFYVGYMLNFTKRNYFIGVSTPWALADEKVWEKTNRLAGKLFWVCGVLAIVSLVTPGDARLWLVLLPVVLTAIIASLYSLYEYMKTKKAVEGNGRKKGGRKK